MEFNRNYDKKILSHIPSSDITMFNVSGHKTRQMITKESV